MTFKIVDGLQFLHVIRLCDGVCCVTNAVTRDVIVY